MLSIKVNLHLHSSFSDGGDTPEEIVETAARLGFDCIGITDHFAPRHSTWLYPGRYLTTNDLTSYYDRMRRLKAQYNNRPVILTGLEIRSTGIGARELPFGEISKADFLLFEDMHDDRNIVETLKYLRGQLPTVPIGLAHLDLSRVPLEELIPVLEQLSIFIELNTGYRWFYRRAEAALQRIADSDVLISVGSDAHSLVDIDDLADAEDAVRQYHLESNLEKLLENLVKKPNGPR